MNTCVKAADVSTRFEKLNNELKRKYLIKNIDRINMIMSHAPGYCGSFGTGYPFYVLDKNLEGDLPVIEEQIRYNDELLNEASDINCWACENCLNTRGSWMPDLKRICKPCPQVKNSIKPRKVINRLPDIDMWMICADGKVEEAKAALLKLFDNYDMHTSDVDPVRTINEMEDIVSDLESGKMPSRMLPLDVHVIEYSKFASLLDEIPFSLLSAMEEGQVPYLPIHPQSLRKTWQYDDEAYNFALDYLYSITPFNWERKLMRKFELSKMIVGNSFSMDDLRSILMKVAPDSVKRRFETPQLQKTYEKRMESWKK